MTDDGYFKSGDVAVMPIRGCIRIEGHKKDMSRDNFTAYKRPKYIEFRDDLPKSNVGKILRRELRSPA